jgi:hypothetical protein
MQWILAIYILAQLDKAINSTDPVDVCSKQLVSQSYFSQKLGC